MNDLIKKKTKNTVFSNFPEMRQILVRMYTRGGHGQDGVQEKKLKKIIFLHLAFKTIKKCGKNR